MLEELKQKVCEANMLLPHSPFAWGKDAHETVHNTVVLETAAEMALQCEQLGAKAGQVPQVQLDKHYFRKHGANAYYGQEAAK